MIKREAKFGLTFRAWMKANPQTFPHGAVFELKQTSTSLPFCAVQEHQINALLATSEGEGGMLYKIPDDSRGIKPFDMFYAKRMPAFIVIKFPKKFEIISVGTFVLEMNRSNRKSLTAQRASEISIISVKTAS